MPLSPDTPLTVLSPHLDDAVLSVGATLAANRHPDTEIWTVYTAGPDPTAVPKARLALGDYATRKAEDHAAAARLGVGVRHLDRTERIWREPQPRSLRALFRGGGLGEPSDLPAVRGCVGEALDRDGVVLAPLAIGNHVDHVEVAVAVIAEALDRRALDRVVFYEDFYALSERLRRQHPVTVAEPRSPRAVAGVRSPAAQLVMSALSRIPTRVDLLGGVSGADHCLWSLRPQPVTEPHEDAKLAAIAAYPSQLALLGPVRGALPSMVRRRHAAHGGEPMWHAALTCRQVEAGALASSQRGR